MPARSLTAVALGLACLAAGCGGDDQTKPADVQQVVKDFAKAVNDKDGKTFCNELTTRSYLEKVTATKGKNAVKQCETQIGSLQLQQKYKVVKFTKTSIKGDNASVTAVLELQGQRRPQVFRLHKEDGKFRLTSGG